MLLLNRKMGPKKGRRVREIDVPTDTPIEFELRDTAADIQQEGEKRTEKERGGSTETAKGGERTGSHKRGKCTLGRGGSG